MANLFVTKPLETSSARRRNRRAHLKRTLGAGSLVSSASANHRHRISSSPGLQRRASPPRRRLLLHRRAVGCVFAGLCYAEFAAMIPVAGSAYTTATHLGEIFAWIIGWDSPRIRLRRSHRLLRLERLRLSLARTSASAFPRTRRNARLRLLLYNGNGSSSARRQKTRPARHRSRDPAAAPRRLQPHRFLGILMVTAILIVASRNPQLQQLHRRSKTHRL